MDSKEMEEVEKAYDDMLEKNFVEKLKIHNILKPSLAGTFYFISTYLRISGESL